MADAGDIWYRSLSGFGHSLGSAIADALQEHRKREEKIGTIDTLLNLGSQVSFSDATGKPHPLVDPKFMEAWSHYSDREKARNAGAFEALIKLSNTVPTQYANQLEQESRARMTQKAETQPFSELRGNIVQNTPSGSHIVGGLGQTGAAREAGVQGRFDAGMAMKRRNELANAIRNGAAIDPEDFSLDSVEGILDPQSGEFKPVENGQAGSNAIAIKKGDQYIPLPAADYMKYKAMADEYNQLGKVAFGNLTGGQQTAPVKVESLEQARALDAGTLFEWNGQVYRVKPRQ